MSSAGGENKRSNTRSTSQPCDCTGLGQSLADVKKKLDTCYKIINNQNVKIDELCKVVGELKLKLDEKTQIDGKISYRDVLKDGAAKEHVLVLKRAANVSDEALRKQLYDNVKPEALQIGVQFNKTTAAGNIILKCDNQKSLEKIRTTVESKMSESCSVELPKKLNPRIKVVGINESELSEDINVLKNKFLNQNKSIGDTKDGSFKIVYKSNVRNKKFDVIAELDPKSFNVIMQEGKLNIGWNRCNVYEYLTMVRCFKCCEYGHIQRVCKNNVVCPLCSESHEKKNCQNNILKCHNCITMNSKNNTAFEVSHAVWDRKCYCLKKLEDVKRGRINYT